MQRQQTPPDAQVNVRARLDHLKAEHARLELRLRELDKHLSLTPDEQIERANLKKAKLQLKDDILRWQHHIQL